MSHSLRAKIKGLRYTGIITDKECDRLCKALDNEQKWIPVSERLPEAGKYHRVLVTVRHKDPTFKGHHVCIGEYDTRFDFGWEWKTGWEHNEMLYVSAWMPLPEGFQ